jgi:hypothetical protein
MQLGTLVSTWVSGALGINLAEILFFNLGGLGLEGD